MNMAVTDVTIFFQVTKKPMRILAKRPYIFREVVFQVPNDGRVFGTGDGNFTVERYQRMMKRKPNRLDGH